MRAVWASSIFNKYGFELAVVIVEIIALLIVALTLLTLFGPGSQGVRAAGNNPSRRRVIKLAALPAQTPDLLRPTSIEPAELYITVTELPMPATNSNPDQIGPNISRNTWPASSPSIPYTPLIGWPVRGLQTQGFGCSTHYTGIPGPDCAVGRPWFHDGLDIGAWAGASVRAALSGTVIFAGPDGDGPPCGAYRGYGLGVIVDNGNGWQALYAHLTEVKVTVGQVVEPNTVIGTVGETGCGTGPHLHFGLRHDGELVDPTAYLKE